MQNMLLLCKCLLILLSARNFGVVNCAPSADTATATANADDSNGAAIIVKTKSGDLGGRIATTLLDQRKFFSFQGIPYAKPPIGPLRFRVRYVQSVLLKCL